MPVELHALYIIRYYYWNGHESFYVEVW